MNNQKVAVIGYGMWGKNIVRNFYNLNVLDTVCDISARVIVNKASFKLKHSEVMKLQELQVKMESEKRLLVDFVQVC